MIVRFLVDEDVNPAVVSGLRRQAPSIDILDVKSAALRGSKILRYWSLLIRKAAS